MAFSCIPIIRSVAFLIKRFVRLCFHLIREALASFWFVPGILIPHRFHLRQLRWSKCCNCIPGWHITSALYRTTVNDVGFISMAQLRMEKDVWWSSTVFSDIHSPATADLWASLFQNADCSLKLSILSDCIRQYISWSIWSIIITSQTQDRSSWYFHQLTATRHLFWSILSLANVLSCLVALKPAIATIRLFMSWLPWAGKMEG